MRLTLLSRVFVRFAIVAAFILTATICSYLSASRFIVISVQVENSHELLHCQEDILSLLKDAETGQRGFLLTGGNDEYLGPYSRAITAIGPKLSEFAALADRTLPRQDDFAGELETLIGEKLAELAKTINLQRSGNAEAALALVRTDQGKRVMDEIRAVMDRSKLSERRRLEEKAGAAR